MRHFRFFLALSLILLTTFTLGQAKAQTPTASNEMVPRKLVSRLLCPPADQAQILVGKLPEQLPVELPLPNQTQIVGSIICPCPPRSVEILLDVAQTTEQVKAFYRERLLATGWRQPSIFAEVDKGGFTDSGSFEKPVNVFGSFCKGIHGPALHIDVNRRSDAPTDVRLKLDSLGLECLPNEIDATPLPPLTPPPNTKYEDGGGGGGSDNFYESNTRMTSQLNVQALAAHYATQLERAGWTRRDGGQSGLFVWSTWTVKDKKGQPWQGIFNLVEVEGRANQYFGYVSVSRL